MQAKKQLASVEKDHKSEVNTIKMKHDSKVALMGEEISALKAQSAKYRRERETLKEMMDSKPRSGRTSAAGDESTELRHKVSDLTYQVNQALGPLILYARSVGGFLKCVHST